MKPVFTDEEYNSHDGFLTSVWGPMVWHFLHIISFNYPTKPTAADKDNYKNYLYYLGKVLPCKYCRDNYKKNLDKCGYSDDVFKNRETFSKFIYKLHNTVTKMLGGDGHFKDYQYVRDRYEIFRARCINKTPLIPRKNIDKNIENGCIVPLYGVRSKSIINIVPKTSKKPSFTIDNKCILKKSKTGKSSKSKKSSRSKKSKKSSKTKKSKKSKK